MGISIQHRNPLATCQRLDEPSSRGDVVEERGERYSEYGDSFFLPRQKSWRLGVLALGCFVRFFKHTFIPCIVYCYSFTQITIQLLSHQKPASDFEHT